MVWVYYEKSQEHLKLQKPWFFEAITPQCQSRGTSWLKQVTWRDVDSSRSLRWGRKNNAIISQEKQMNCNPKQLCRSNRRDGGESESHHFGPLCFCWRQYLVTNVYYKPRICTSIASWLCKGWFLLGFVEIWAEDRTNLSLADLRGFHPLHRATAHFNWFKG